jgi:hypothetical protein
MYSNGSNTAQKLESLEKKVGNLQETVSDIQPMKIAATKTVSKVPYIYNSVNDTEPLESMVYKKPVAKKAARVAVSPEAEAISRASGQWGSYAPYIELDYGIKGQEQEQQGYDMIYNAVLAGRPVPSLDDVISDIGARPAPEVPAGFVATKKVARSVNGSYIQPQSNMQNQYQMIPRKTVSPMKQPYNNSGQNQSYMPQPLIASKKISQGYVKAMMQGKNRPMNDDTMDDLPPQAATKMPPLISTYQPPQPINSDKEVIASLLGFTTPILSQIQSDVEKLISPLNKLVLSVGEADITTKKLSSGGAVKKAPKPPKKTAAKKTAKKINASPSISEVQWGVKEISATITARLAALQRGIQAVSTHLPCEPCDSSGPTEGGSRVKKSIKTRRNRRS